MVAAVAVAANLWGGRGRHGALWLACLSPSPTCCYCRLRADTATLSVQVQATGGAQAATLVVSGCAVCYQQRAAPHPGSLSCLTLPPPALQDALSNSAAMTQSVQSYLATQTSVPAGFSASSTAPQAFALTNVNVTLTAADQAANKCAALRGGACDVMLGLHRLLGGWGCLPLTNQCLHPPTPAAAAAAAAAAEASFFRLLLQGGLGAERQEPFHPAGVHGLSRHAREHPGHHQQCEREPHPQLSPRPPLRRLELIKLTHTIPSALPLPLFPRRSLSPPCLSPAQAPAPPPPPPPAPPPLARAPSPAGCGLWWVSAAAWRWWQVRGPLGLHLHRMKWSGYLTRRLITTHCSAALCLSCSRLHHICAGQASAQPRRGGSRRPVRQQEGAASVPGWCAAAGRGRLRGRWRRRRRRCRAGVGNRHGG